MDLLMNGLLLAATCFAGGYCWVLARRVRELKSLDSGLGGAIVTLTRQVELARTTLEEARASSRDTRVELSQLVQRADTAAGQLRLLIAAGPLPGPQATRRAAPPPQSVAEPLSEPRLAATARREPPLRVERTEAPFETPADVAAETAEDARPEPKLVRPPEPEAPRPRAATPLAFPSLDKLIGIPLAAGPLDCGQVVSVLPATSAPVTGPRAVEPGPPHPPVPHLTEVPKPRALAPIANPLRRMRPTKARPVSEPAPSGPAPSDAGGEDAILEALSALAGGR